MTASICSCDCFLNIISSFFQTEQMKRIGNELDSVHFSLKKASQMVKEIGRQVLPRSLALKCFFLVTLMWLNLQDFPFQVATDKCIMAFLFLIVCGVIAIIVVKVCC